MTRSTLVRPVLRATSLLAIIAVVNVASAQATPKVPARPTLGPAKVPVFPKITTETLPNGVRLAVIENHTLPIVAVRVGFAGGFFLDAPGKEGGWTVMVALLQEGSTTRSGAAVAEAAADYGTAITWSPSVPFVGAPSFTTVRSAFRPMLELVADILMHPSFPVDAFPRVQGLQAANATRLPQQSATVNLLNAKLYGANHPYGRSFLGTAASVRALTRDDIVVLQTTYLRPQNTVVVVAGDVTLAEARGVVERAFASWERTGTTVEPNIPAPPPRVEPTTIYLRDDPGAPTSTIYTGLVVPGRGGSDAMAIEAVNTVLGGTQGAGRMWQAFRVDRGLSYFPASGLIWHPEPQVGAWNGLAQVPAAKTDTAVTEWLRVIRETHGDRPLTAAELDFARSNIVGTLPGQIATVDAVATSTLTLLQTRLPTTFFGDYVARLNALTLAQFQAAAAKYLDPDHLVIAVVGDRAKIEAPLRATGIPVVIIDH
jgi:Predicted Zn-dependent peptidases